MINADMREYDYYTLDGRDAYGQPQLADKPAGTIRMAINITSQSIQDNILYKDCTYVGLTMAEVSDAFVVDYDGVKLKVLYVNPRGRYKQAFMTNYE